MQCYDKIILMIPCNILLGPTSHTLVIVLSVIFGVFVPILIVIIIIIVVACIWKKYGTGTYWPWQAEINQGVELEGDKKNEESRSESATAANPPPQTENEA